MHEGKPAVLASSTRGWNGPGSLPMSEQARANYVAWSTDVPDDRVADAEPMLTDGGDIRLEWESAGHHRIAEIGVDTLYMVDLAPNAVDDDSTERTFDAAALTRFFINGELT